jgi:hypothetical protein
MAYFSEINRVFRQNGIKAVIIKGLSFSRFFPDSVRYFGDVDLIVLPENMLSVKKILENQFGFRVDMDEFYDFAKSEEKIVDGTIDYIHVVYGNEKLWIEAHPATTYWSWVNLRSLYENAVEENGLYLLTPVDCFHMAAAHIWNHNPQHIQHVSHGICTLKLYVDLREIYLYLLRMGMKEELYNSIISNQYESFSFEALKTCEQLFSEQLIEDDFPIPERILDRAYITPFVKTDISTLIFEGRTETDRLKRVYYENLERHQLKLTIPSYRGIEEDWRRFECWSQQKLNYYNNYHVPGNFFWPRRTVNYFYPFYNVPINTAFALQWSERGIYLYGESNWNPENDINDARFNFHTNYLRFLFGNRFEDTPVSILLQAKNRVDSSVFTGEKEYGAAIADGCLSSAQLHGTRYYVTAFIPWKVLNFEHAPAPGTHILFDIITHHAESDVPAMIAWAGGMGSEKMFGCDYFAKAAVLK